MGSTSKTFPLSREMTANIQLLLVKLLQCHIPSHETLVSTTMAKYLMYYCVFQW